MKSAETDIVGRVADSRPSANSARGRVEDVAYEVGSPSCADPE